MATTELEPEQATAEVASPSLRARFERLPRPALPLDRVRELARGRPWPDALAIALLLACTVVVYWPTIVGAGVYARSDSLTFFYPVFAALHQAIREGDLPLWTPYIFGGFPLFAEGQIGALYPPARLAVLLPSPVDGFLALRVFHVWVAVLGAYTFVRCLGTTPFGGLVGGLAFGFGSFVVAQQHHANLLAAAVWLPLLLTCVELALRRATWLSQCYLALAGLLMGLQALASHVQPVMLGGGLFLFYVWVRQVSVVRASCVGARSWAERRRAGLRPVLRGVWTMTLVPLLGAAIAAVQLLPLWELSRESSRGHGWSYQAGAEYSFPLANFVTLLFPFFFRTPDGGQWSLWQSWEVILYVGVVPLVLAVLAIVFVRRWSVALFGIVGAASTFVALGHYAPFGLYERFWGLSALALQRAPARFTFLTALSLAVLAAHGADWLARRRGDEAHGPRSRDLLLLHVGVLVGLGVLVGHLVMWRAWLAADQPWALRVLSERYLGELHDPLQALGPLTVYSGLDAALNLGNPKTAMPLVILGLFALLVLAWREAPRFARAWRGALLALVLVDLIVFSVDFHPLIAADRLPALGPVGEFLAARTGPWRSLTHRDVETTRPNQLLPARAAEVAGYSPLELSRQSWYATVVGTVDNNLLDLWGVRYVVTSAASSGLPSYDGVGYHPQRPLMIGGAATPNGRLALQVPSDPVTELRMVAALKEGITIPDGEVVGEWLLTDAQGVRRVLPVRAGREVADWATGDSGVRTAHRPVQVASSVPIPEPRDGIERSRKLSYAAIPLPSRQVITRAEYRHVHPLGQTILYGMALFDRQTDSPSQFYLPDKYSVVYRDDEAVVYENRSHFPRAFVVPEAVRVATAEEALARLIDGPFDPVRQVVLETGAAEPAPSSTGLADGRVDLFEDRSRLVSLRVSSASGGYLVLADPYYPGWRGFVDGVEVEVLRANYLFRAVALGPGEHDVAFYFDPPSLRLGGAISLVGLAVALGLIGIGLDGDRLSAWLRRRRYPPEML